MKAFCLVLGLAVGTLVGCGPSVEQRAAVMQIRREIVALATASQPTPRKPGWFEIRRLDFAERIEQLTISARTYEKELTPAQRLAVVELLEVATDFGRRYERIYRFGTPVEWEDLTQRLKAVSGSVSNCLARF